MTPTSASSPLAPEERALLEANPWFAGLAQPLQDAIVERGQVRRVRHASVIAPRGQPAQEWIAVVRGAVRLSAVSLSGRQIIVGYSRPGTWLGDTALVDDRPNPHDLTAQGDTTLVAVRKQDFRELLVAPPGLAEALLLLDAGRVRALYEQVESFATLPLAARLAQQVLALARDFGAAEADGVRIRLQLAQEDVAQLLGASRQRVNRELKNFERQGILRVEPAGLLVVSEDRLRAAVAGTA